MGTVNLRLYDIFRKDLKLQEAGAKELVEVIHEVVKEEVADKHEHIEKMVLKDMQILKQHMDKEFGHMKEFMTQEFAHLDTKFATKTDLANTRVEIVRWMFLFWIGQIAATFGFILLFLKK